MNRFIVIAGLLVFPMVSSIAVEGVIEVKSQFSVKETADRLEKIVQEKGIRVFNRLNHSKGAAAHGVELRDTELVIFGNPKIGGPLMKCQQSVAIDLPQKALIREDENGEVWISYNDPKYLQQRHEISDCGDVITKIGKALANISGLAASQ